MKKNILQQTGTRTEEYTVTVADTPEGVNEHTGEVTPAVTHEEVRTREVPVMASVTVDMTPEEEAEMLASVPAPTTEEQIAALKAQLAASDYKAIKYAEGWITESDYAPIRAERQAIRAQINELEA